MPANSCHAALPGAIARLGYALLSKSLSTGDVGSFFSPLSIYYALTLALNGAGMTPGRHSLKERS